MPTSEPMKQHWKQVCDQDEALFSHLRSMYFDQDKQLTQRSKHRRLMWRENEGIEHQTPVLPPSITAADLQCLYTNEVPMSIYLSSYFHKCGKRRQLEVPLGGVDVKIDLHHPKTLLGWRALYDLPRLSNKDVRDLYEEYRRYKNGGDALPRHKGQLCRS